MTANLKGPFGVMYHHFYSDEHPYIQGAISAEEFENSLIWLKERYTLVDALTWENLTLSGELNENHVCITFDDAIKSQLDVATPVLEKHDLTAFWYVYTSPIEGFIEKLELYRYYRNLYFDTVDAFYDKFFEVAEYSDYASRIMPAKDTADAKSYLNEFSFYSEYDRVFRYIRDKILVPEEYYTLVDSMIAQDKIDTKELTKKIWISKSDITDISEKGHLIGLHSHSHPTNVDHLTFEEQEEEYKENKEILENLISRPIQSASYPSNSYNDDTISILKDLGVQYAFRANMHERSDSLFEIPRIDHTDLIREIKNSKAA